MCNQPWISSLSRPLINSAIEISRYPAILSTMANSNQDHPKGGITALNKVESSESPKTFETIKITEPPFSTFSRTEKRWITFAASFAAMFSGLSSFIYYLAVVPLARDLGVSLQLINLTITSYLIVAGIAPAFMGDMADQTGRRPVYILTFSLYFGANIGLAVQKSYPALLVLRMVQSAGSSGSSWILRIHVKVKDWKRIRHVRDCIWRHIGCSNSRGKRFLCRDPDSLVRIIFCSFSRIFFGALHLIVH